MRKLVIDIHEQNHVLRSFGQLRIDERAQYVFNVLHLLCRGSLLQKPQHLRLNLHRKHLPLFTHRLGDGQRVETVARAQIADHLTFLDAQHLEHRARILFAIT